MKHRWSQTPVEAATEAYGFIRLPAADCQLRDFMDANQSRIAARHRSILERLNLEAINNRNLEIEFEGNA